MNTKIITLFAALSLWMIACSPKTTQEVETIVFDYSSETPLYQYDRVESISLTPLQTDDNCLIGNEPMLRFAGDNLFILHGQYTHLERIDRFNTQGKFLNQIGRRGRGPGEISFTISDWFFCGDNMIGLRGFFDKNILLYDFAGNFVREIHLNTPSTRFGGGGPAFMAHLHGSDFLALMPAQTDSARLIRLSEHGEEAKSMLRSDKTFTVDLDALSHPFFQTNGKLYYSSIHDHAIYKAEQDTVSLAFLTHPGKYAIPPDFYNSPSYRALEGLFHQNGIVAVYNFMESSDYYVIQLVVMQETFEGLVWGIKHKREKEWFWSRMETWEPGARGYSLSGITEDNRLLILVPPYTLKGQLPLMKNVLNPQVAASIKEDDNPVLVELRLK
ncbi:MAG: 6-bladed beta-propeller [Bacteroidales bacterium]|nr:6-bladed beta-propeller [Bacteroidales bacterium]